MSYLERLLLWTMTKIESMIFFYLFIFIFLGGGVLGNWMLNSGVPKCHEDLITLETYVQQGKQSIWGPGGGGGGPSIIRMDPSWFTSTLSFILIYMSNLEEIC